MKLSDQAKCTLYHSPLGPMTLAAAGGQLVGVWFADQAHLPDLSGCVDEPDHPVLRLAAAQLSDYFAGQQMPWCAIAWHFLLFVYQAIFV